MLRIGIQQREHHQHSQAAEAPDKGQDQDKIGRERRKDEGRVHMPLQVSGIIQDQPFLPAPSSSLCLGSWSLCFSFSWLPLAPRVLQLRGREGVRGQPALLSLPSLQQEPPDPSSCLPLCVLPAGQSHIDTLHHRAAQKTSLRSGPET